MIENLYQLRGEYEHLRDQHRRKLAELNALYTSATTYLKGYQHYHQPHHHYTIKPDIQTASDLLKRMETVIAEADALHGRINELTTLLQLA